MLNQKRGFDDENYGVSFVVKEPTRRIIIA
jgi:hypothetical protein